MNEYIICLGGGAEQVELVKKIEAMNFKSIVVDKNLNCKAKKYSSIFINESTHSPDKIINRLDNLKLKKIKSIVNRSSGYPVYTCAVLSEFLGLENLDPKIASKVITKQGFRDELKKIDVNNVKTFVNYLDIKKYLSESDLVIKPSFGEVGKSSIKKISDIEDFDNAAKVAKNASQNGNIIIEQFIDGFDYVCMGFVINSNFQCLAFLKENNNFNNKGELEGNGFSFPEKTDLHIKEESLRIAKKLSKNLGIISSPFNLSLRHCSDSGKLFPVELHLDLSGDFIYEELLSKFAHFSLFENAIKCSFGDGVLLQEVFGNGMLKINTIKEKRVGTYINE
tara:strand:+ start:936 stop:1946 length:1011 start_codon:yes stop_codon:yes gene_type:complete